VRTLTETDITVDIWGETKNAETDQTVTSVSGKVLYHRNVGEKAVVTVDLEGTKITVAPDLYLDVSLQIVSDNGGTSTYVDVLIFDYSVDGKGDGELDFFVSLSKFAGSSDVSKPAEYKPLKIYAPAGEIMTVLSSGLMLLGIDVDILNNYLVYDWLNMQTVEQLQAFGSMLTLTMQLDGETLLQGFLAALKGAVGDANAKVLKDAFVNAIVVGDEEFKVTLNPVSVYDNAKLENLTFSLLKGVGENGTLRGFTFYNVYSNDCKEVTNVEIGINTEKIEETSLKKNISISGEYSNNYYNGYYDLSGIGTLVKAIANTATHTATEEEIAAGTATAGQQVINTNYYITGVISANLFGRDAISIQTALSIDLNKDGKGGVMIRLRLNYSGYSLLGYTIIKGNKNQLDLTLDLTDMMVYMERNTDGTIVDRAMPLSVFGGDFLGQLAFILNFSDDIANAMASSDSSTNTESAVRDYGEMLGGFLKSYSYDADKHVWAVVLNGDGLTGGTMGDINLSIGAEEEAENNNALALSTIGASMNLQLDSLVNGFLGTILKAFTITI
ncbi:MAG: hypothetical protein K2K12_01090, partial [Clostridia bacterium]|nr:hypothetical protein [Clostridia bacterium]